MFCKCDKMNGRKLCEIISEEPDGMDTLLDIGCEDCFLVSCLAKK